MIKPFVSFKTAPDAVPCERRRMRTNVEKMNFNKQPRVVWKYFHIV